MWDHVTSTSTTGADHHRDRNEDIGSDDSFFKGLDEVEVLEPMSVTPLRAVQMDEPIRPRNRSDSATSTSGRGDRETTFEVQIDRDHPRYFDYEGYSNCHPYN